MDGKSKKFIDFCSCMNIKFFPRIDEILYPRSSNGAMGASSGCIWSLYRHNLFPWNLDLEAGYLFQLCRSRSNYRIDLIFHNQSFKVTDLKIAYFHAWG